jgi:EmrB/QacA subfamily drug resistance transporter
MMSSFFHWDRATCNPAVHHPPFAQPSGRLIIAGVSPDGRRWILPATILGSSLSFIDSSVVNIALPAIRSDLEASLPALQWVVNGYMLTLASLILLGGSAGDRFGRRRIFLFGLVGFVAASVACGLAPAVNWLIGARLVQGIAAALLTPASLAIIGAAYEGESRGAAIGTWAAAAAITTALGPPLGGWLVDTVGWRAIFLINVPVGALALLFGLRLPRDPPLTTSDPLDVSGALLATFALGSLSYGLVALGDGRPTVGWIGIAAALPAVAWLIRVEARARAPMMPLDLFRNRTFAGANALTVVLYAALSGALFLLPFVLVEVHRYSATAAGAAFLPFSVIMGAGSRWAGSLASHIGARTQMVLGPAIVALGYVLLGFSSESPGYLSGVLPGLSILAAGMTLTIPPLTTTVFDASPNELSGTASGINNAAARAGGLIAIAAIGLAFGAGGFSNASASTILEGYRSVTFTAAGLAALSALIAAWTISSTPENEGWPAAP